MKKIKPVLITMGVITGIYFTSALVFRMFLYDAPPPIEKAQLAMFEVKNGIPQAQAGIMAKELRNMAGVSGCSLNPANNRIAIIYKNKKTNPEILQSSIQEKTGWSVVPYTVEQTSGKGCPYHGFLNKIAPLFTWF